MGGFLGIGKSSEARELERQNALKLKEAERARKEAAIRLAEKRARKGQETANIKLGTTQVTEQEEELERSGRRSSPSNSLALGQAPRKKTGVQI